MTLFFMFYNIFLQFFCQKICIYQIKAVPLHSKSEKVVTNLHRRSVTGNAGERPSRNSRCKNTYRKRAEKKERTSFRFRRFALFSFSLTYASNLFPIILPSVVALAKSLVHICETLRSVVFMGFVRILLTRYYEYFTNLVDAAKILQIIDIRK